MAAVALGGRRRLRSRRSCLRRSGARGADTGGRRRGRGRGDAPPARPDQAALGALRARGPRRRSGGDRRQGASRRHRRGVRSLAARQSRRLRARPACARSARRRDARGRRGECSHDAAGLVLVRSDRGGLRARHGANHRRGRAGAGWARCRCGPAPARRVDLAPAGARARRSPGRSPIGGRWRSARYRWTISAESRSRSEGR